MGVLRKAKILSSYEKSERVLDVQAKLFEDAGEDFGSARRVCMVLCTTASKALNVGPATPSCFFLAFQRTMQTEPPILIEFGP
ncbi:MAG TPA: hypothetical protein DD400_00060 [Rhodospirillaceae bacterium]|nr:hypothetical protein [Rhodospirillaceae bacterium]